MCCEATNILGIILALLYNPYSDTTKKITTYKSEVKT